MQAVRLVEEDGSESRGNEEQSRSRNDQPDASHRLHSSLPLSLSPSIFVNGQKINFRNLKNPNLKNLLLHGDTLLLELGSKDSAGLRERKKKEKGEKP